MLNIKERIESIRMDTIQQEPLFTELTPEAAAAVEGGAKANFREDVKFDFFRSTRSFNVRPGGGIKLYTNTGSPPSNPSFKAAVRNVKTGKSTPTEIVQIGGGTFPLLTEWTNMRGGTYKIDFVDTKDGINVNGVINVEYDA